jgi:hypothetical protein
MESENIQMMPIENIVVEDGAHDVMNSPDMRRYLDSAEAAITGQGSDKATKAISELPLESRYIWRIANSLKQGFCDFDKSSVRADLGTMNAADFDTVMGLLDRRPIQFCMFLRTVLGAAEMESVMMEAVAIAKRY